MATRQYRVSSDSLTVSQILTILDQEPNNECREEKLIYVQPPDDGIETDADSDKSDDEHEGNLNHLGRNLLLSKCEVQTASLESQIGNISSREGQNINTKTSDDGTEMPAKRSRRKLSCENESNHTVSHVPSTSKIVDLSTPSTSKDVGLNNRNTTETTPKWTKSQTVSNLITDCVPVPPSNDAQKCETPLDFFYLFFNDDVLSLICEQTNLYASQKNCNLNVTRSEILVFIGGMLLSGYAKYPNKRMFWSKENDVPTILSRSIRCNRFELILRHFHLNDNNHHDGSDRLFKLRPLLILLQSAFRKHGGIDEAISIDESMIPYYGKHYAKQFIRGKPIRFGFKNWAICSASGYMISFQVYTGKEIDRPKEFGLGGSVVLSLIDDAGIQANRGHKIFFDNYFTSVKLLRHLASMGICATGTLQENRTEKCPLRSKADMKKEERGSYDYSSCGDVMLVRWHDNSVVTAGTNYGELQIGSASRWSSGKKSKVSVPQPSIFTSYNKGMGGVDQLDQFVSTYRSRMRQKKWWWPIFAYFLDVSVVNGWLLQRKVHPTRDEGLLKFRRYIALTLLKQHGEPSHRGKMFPSPTQEVRYDGLNHWPQTNDTERRCALCKGKAKFVCSKCNVGLHPKCFYGYHNR